MSPHALTFPLIMIAVGLWQFRRAGRMAKAKADLDAASIEQRRIFEAHGYPPLDAARTRIIGAALIAVGVGYFLAGMWMGRSG